MNLDEIRCAHTCRNACQMLNDALRLERELLQYHERILKECDYPDVKDFVQEMVVEKSASILRILQKLNELRARGQILDGVISSYNPET